MKIIAYTYESDVHCVSCTVLRFAHSSVCGLDLDPNGIWYGHTDSDGNPIHPVFSTDETNFTHCSDCGAEL